MLEIRKGAIPPVSASAGSGARGEVLLYHNSPSSSSLGLVAPQRHLRFHLADPHAFRSGFREEQTTKPRNTKSIHLIGGIKGLALFFRSFLLFRSSPYSYSFLDSQQRLCPLQEGLAAIEDPSLHLSLHAVPAEDRRFFSVRGIRSMLILGRFL